MNAAKKKAIHIGAGFGQASGLFGLLEKLGRTTPGGLHVLMYHRVADPESSPSLYPGLISATPSGFERQMVMLRERYRVVSCSQVEGALADGKALPPRSVLLTFDDAYKDFLENAWPTLKRLELPATLFVPSGFAGARGEAFWWDRLFEAVCCAEPASCLLAMAGLPSAEEETPLDVYRRLRERITSLPHAEAVETVAFLCASVGAPEARSSVLGWDDLRMLAGEGLTLGGHTRSHPLLDRITPERVRAEISEGFDDIRREIGKARPVFAYPGGACPDEAVSALRSEGTALAFTTRMGVAELQRDDPLLLPRIPVGRAVTLPTLRALLLPQVARLNGLWRG